MNFPEKRKENSARQTPPLHPPQTELGLCRLGNTDFQDVAERASFQKIGLIPQDFCKREGEFSLDMKFFAEELTLLGIKKDSIEHAAMMVRMGRELPSADEWKKHYE